MKTLNKTICDDYCLLLDIFRDAWSKFRKSYVPQASGLGLVEGFGIPNWQYNWEKKDQSVAEFPMACVFPV
jgi:hypothetical protein